ncbi:MAG: hypothetical protein Q9M44_06210 [Ghiorsea sp.]|nr:hypothetical protein [Ghiorsea sp.]
MFTKTLQMTIGASCLMLVGCSSTASLGHFTAASTHNVRNLDYNVANNTSVRTEGESCSKSFIGIPFGVSENRQQIALDSAIRSGQDSGTDGDMLVNVLITETDFGFLGYRSNCITIKGDLVRLEK